MLHGFVLAAAQKVIEVRVREIGPMHGLILDGAILSSIRPPAPYEVLLLLRRGMLKAIKSKRQFLLDWLISGIILS